MDFVVRGDIMKCPRCGSFVDGNKSICFMCGASLSGMTPDVPEQNNNGGFDNVNPFGNTFNNNDINQNVNNVPVSSSSNFSGMNDFVNSNFNNGNSGFNNPDVNNMDNNNFDNMFGKKDEVVMNDDYKNIKLEDIKTDKDFFDFMSEHKKGIYAFLIILVLGGLGFGLYLFIQNKNAPEKKEPLVGNLYYKVGEDFDLIQDSPSNKIYSLTGAKGSDCSISIINGTTTSGNHVNDFFDGNESTYAPKIDQQGNVLDPLESFEVKKDELKVNGQLWSRQYFYYRKDLNTSEFSLLKKIFLTTMYKGYYYDISLVNNSNSTSCNVELDSFINSLEFVKTDKK